MIFLADKSMRINIHEIPPQGNFFDFSLSNPWIKELVKKTGEFNKEFKIDLSVIRDKDMVIIRGNIKGDLRLDCSRCCEKFALQVDRNFLSTYCKEFEKRKSIHEEVKLTKADLDLTFYNGDEIDLEELLNEQIQLSVPYRPICNEECKGLCSYCGKNLNVEECHCEREGWNLKFSALLGLKDDNRVGK